MAHRSYWAGSAATASAGRSNYFSGTLHIPSALGFLVITSEAFGSLGLLLGLGTRLAAFGSAATMIGAVLTTHLQVGFFMNWFGNQPGEGLEYHLLALALALPLVVRGGGAFALDRKLLAALTIAPDARRGTRDARRRPTRFRRPRLLNANWNNKERTAQS